jgi:hypothetical protein
MNAFRGHAPSAIVVCLVASLAAACAPQQGMTAKALPPPVAIVAPRQPPPPLAEQVPPAPPASAGHFVWNPGHYHWNYTAKPTGTDADFTWLPGHFVEQPYPTSVWTNGNWTQRDGAWGWTPGYWQ